jgi:hypothetical protein
VSSEECSKTATILKHAHDSTSALLRAYRFARAMRGVKKDEKGAVKATKLRGMSTDEEQDLLRAMLVIAAAGLDAIAKQIIRDALPTLILKDQRALAELEKFVARRLRNVSDNGDDQPASAFLARILCAPSAQQKLIEEYIADLTGASLQSATELYRVAAALAIDTDDLGIDKGVLKPIFDCRNKIVHELDINLEAARRNRNLRRESTMIQYAATLITIGERMVYLVDDKLCQAA